MAALTPRRCPRLPSPCRITPASCKAVLNQQRVPGQGERTAGPTIHTEPNKSAAYVDNIRKQIQNISKFWTNLSNAVNYLGAVELPDLGRLLPDFQRFVPGSSSRNNDGDNFAAKTNFTSQTSSQAEKDVRKNVKLKSSVKVPKQMQAEHRGSFEKLMQETHDSVRSYYDLTNKTDGANYTVKTKNTSTSVTQSETSQNAEEGEGLFSKFVKAYRIVDPSPDIKPDKIPLIRKDFVSRTALFHRTKSLIEALKTCSTDTSKIVRLEEFCKHVLDFPESRSMASKEGLLPILLRLRNSDDAHMKGAAREALALVGYIDPVKGRGIRILTVDGGGTKGLVAIETMKKLEEACKREITELFDLVVGVSTGALILAMVFMFHVPLHECEHLYKQLSMEMFTRNKFVGTGKLVWNHAFYDTEIWENILKENLGDQLMISLSRDPAATKMACFSCLMNAPKLKNFIFRNYNLPPEVFSHYPGNCKQKVWEAIRASSAAPGYYEDCKLGDFIHQDGGVLSNNPTALAVHEGKLLWPQEAIQCVISLGNGRHEPSLELTTANKITLKDKVSKIVDSATDTEAVHTTLQDLMAPSTYYRFNPYLSEDFMLDEIDPDKQECMQRDAQLYLRKNDLKIQRSAEQLLLGRRPHQKAADWFKQKADMI